MDIEYYENIKLHQKYRSRAYRLKEKEIISFSKKWDPQPYHTNPDLAKNTQFRGLSAAGIHLVAICIKLVNEKVPRPAYILGMGWDKVRFVAPARPHDVLTVEIEAIRKRVSKSYSHAGIVRFATRLLNQYDEAVLTMEGTTLIERQSKF